MLFFFVIWSVTVFRSVNSQNREYHDRDDFFNNISIKDEKVNEFELFVVRQFCFIIYVLKSFKGFNCGLFFSSEYVPFADLILRTPDLVNYICNMSINEKSINQTFIRCQQRIYHFIMYFYIMMNFITVKDMTK